jgi:peptidoglycan hydrolase-like protein with peptidoglycan-binding domain
MKWGRIVGGVVAAAVLIGGGVFVGQRSGGDGPAEEFLIVPRPVERRDLDDVLVVRGEVRREEIQKIILPDDGKVSSVEVASGDVVEVGQTLFALNGRAVVAVAGDFSFYRRLDVGSEGPDVAQLKRVLADAGYPIDRFDSLFTEQTRTALAAWQRDRGYGGATQEPVETVTVVLGQNPAGYSLGTTNATSFSIVPREPTGSFGSARRATTLPPVKPTIEVTATPGEVDEGDVVTLRFTADPPPTRDLTVALTITGDATGGSNPRRGADYESIPTSFVFPAGAAVFERQVPVFVDEVKEALEEIIVTLTTQFGNDPNYIVGPLSQARVAIRANGDDLVPVITVQASGARVPEGGVATFTFTSTVESNEPLDLTIRLDGTAVNGVDYFEIDLEREFVTIPAGSRTTTLQVRTKADDVIEPDETIVVSVVPDPEGDPAKPPYVVGNPGTATVVLESADLPELSIVGGGNVFEGDTTRFTIFADRAVVRDTSINYQVGGTATPGADYEPLTGTVIMRAGTNSVTVEIVTIDDDVVFLPSDMVVADWPARVGSVEVAEGEFALKGAPVLTLTEPIFTVRLTVSPSDRSKLSVGQRVVVSLGSSSVDYDGIIESLEESASVGRQGEEVYEGVVAIEGELDAVDGAQATIDVVLEERIGVLVVPVASVLRSGGTEEVRVVNDEGTISRVAVSIGLIDGEWAEVTSGLEGGELVIVDVDPRAAG